MCCHDLCFEPLGIGIHFKSHNVTVLEWRECSGGSVVVSFLVALLLLAVSRNLRCVDDGGFELWFDYGLGGTKLSAH